jgi:hypothetical protein
MRCTAFTFAPAETNDAAVCLKSCGVIDGQHRFADELCLFFWADHPATAWQPELLPTRKFLHKNRPQAKQPFRSAVAIFAHNKIVLQNSSCLKHFSF